MIKTRIHPGLAAIAVVAGFTVLMLFLQSREQKPVVLAPQPTAATVQTPPIQPPQTAKTLSGVARVIDGDTIDVHGTHIRLNGIDAPESKQTCDLNGQAYPCGQKATEALIVFLGARPVECSATGKDRYQRIIARCRVESTDLGNWMVEHGGRLVSQYSQ